MNKPARIPTCHPERHHRGHGLCDECYYAQWRESNREKLKEYADNYRKEYPDKAKQIHNRWYQANLEYARERARSYRAQHLEAELARSLRRSFGLSVDQYSDMMAAQNGVCAICGGKNKHGRRLFVDHDHKTGEIRALLCRNCNNALGMVDDQVGILEKMIHYLSRHKNKEH